MSYKLQEPYDFELVIEKLGFKFKGINRPYGIVAFPFEERIYESEDGETLSISWERVLCIKYKNKEKAFNKVGTPFLKQKQYGIDWLEEEFPELFKAGED